MYVLMIRITKYSFASLKAVVVFVLFFQTSIQALIVFPSDQSVKRTFIVFTRNQFLFYFPCKGNQTPSNLLPSFSLITLNRLRKDSMKQQMLVIFIHLAQKHIQSQAFLRRQMKSINAFLQHPKSINPCDVTLREQFF